MPSYRTYALAAAAAALAAMAISGWHSADAEAVESNVQAQRSHSRPVDTHTEGAYLPGLFVEEERAARIEPLPPQF